MTEPYLYTFENRYAPERSNGKRFWGYPTRANGTRPRVIGVHTAESAFDQIGPDTGAEGVARYQATTDRPSSYHQIVDRDSTIVMLPDEATAFGIGKFNTPTLHLSFALRASDWGDPAKRNAAEPMLARGAAVAKAWAYKYDIPLVWLTREQADAGARGFLRHGTYDPLRRSDPGAYFPADRFFSLIRGTRVDRHLKLTDPMMRGQDVKDIQNALRHAGFNVDLDGIYGPATANAINTFNRSKRITVAGCGPETWAALRKIVHG